MSATTVSFVGVLVRSCRFLLPVLDEHLSEQDGEVLPHLFMWSVERWAEAALRDDRNDELNALFAQLDVDMSGPDEDVRELISVSFLELLPRAGEMGDELRSFAGPACADELRAIG